MSSFVVTREGHVLGKVFFTSVEGLEQFLSEAFPNDMFYVRTEMWELEEMTAKTFTEHMRVCLDAHVQIKPKDSTDNVVDEFWQVQKIEKYE